jgi:hypothetical protein
MDEAATATGGRGFAEDPHAAAARPNALSNRLLRPNGTRQFSRIPMRGMRLRLNLEKLGIALVFLVTLLTLLLLGVVGSFKTASSELHRQVQIARNEMDTDPASPIGQQLSALLAPDLRGGSIAAMEVRSIELDHRADRLLEATAVVALIGMLLPLLAARPASEVALDRADTTPLASTSNNGTV